MTALIPTGESITCYADWSVIVNQNVSVLRFIFTASAADSLSVDHSILFSSIASVATNRLFVVKLKETWHNMYVTVLKFVAHTFRIVSLSSPWSEMGSLPLQLLYGRYFIIATICASPIDYLENYQDWLPTAYVWHSWWPQLDNPVPFWLCHEVHMLYWP